MQHLQAMAACLVLHSRNVKIWNLKKVVKFSPPFFMDKFSVCIKTKNLIMKKIILVAVVCVVYASSYAQNNESPAVAPPPPPAAQLPPPPPPPLPPPPPPPVLYQKESLANTNEKGYNLSIETINGTDVVLIKKKGKTEKISAKEWFQMKDRYESKYGILLPSPPVPVLILEAPVPPLPASPIEN